MFHNYTTKTVYVDIDSDEWDKIEHYEGGNCHSIINREHLLDITEKYIVVGDVRHRDMETDVLSDIIGLTDKWKAEGKETWASKFLNEMIEERVKMAEMFSYLDRDKCKFFYEVKTPIYTK